MLIFSKSSYIFIYQRFAEFNHYSIVNIAHKIDQIIYANQTIKYVDNMWITIFWYLFLVDNRIYLTFYVDYSFHL